MYNKRTKNLCVDILSRNFWSCVDILSVHQTPVVCGSCCYCKKGGCFSTQKKNENQRSTLFINIIIGISGNYFYQKIAFLWASNSGASSCIKIQSTNFQQLPWLYLMLAVVISLQGFNKHKNSNGWNIKMCWRKWIKAMQMNHEIFMKCICTKIGQGQKG